MRAEVGRRRASYGPTSPEIGALGAKTAAAIPEAALAVFTRKGYHETTIADIAAELGLSRATLYQYFESKEQIFVRVLDECGAAVIDVTRRLGELGPTPEGFANLRWWLDEWARVYARYAVVFAEWTSVDGPDAPVGSLVSDFNVRFSQRIARRLAESGVSGDPLDIAVVITGIVLRWNQLRRARGTSADGDDDGEPEYDFAVLVQLMLFPDTPPEATGHAVPRRWHTRRVSGRLEPSPAGRPWSTRDPRGGLTARSAATVRALLASGSRVFAAGGFPRASVDEIAANAGYARGTFYKYFATKTAMLEALAEACTQESITAARRLEQVDDFPGLLDWCRSILDLSRSHQAVFRAWLERSPMTPDLREMRAAVVRSLRRSLFLHLSGVDRGHPMELGCATTFVAAVFDQVPGAFELNRRDIEPDAAAELIATLLDRALFGWTNRD